ncbi:MAG: thymidine phosphorylase, partial [Ignavibacteria bacterium]
FGKKAIAVLTDMEQPLGRKIGNWLEVEECIELMNGGMVPDLYKLTNVLAGAMIYLGGKADSIREGEKIAEEKLMDKSAYNKFLEIIKIQNGDVEYVKDWANLKRSKHTKEILAEEDGFVSEMTASDFGYAAIELGCGRKKVEDKIDYLAGIILKKKCGDEVKKGDVICELFAHSDHKLDKGVARLEGAIKISKSKPVLKDLILEILE